MKNKGLFIKNVFTLIRNRFPEFTKLPIGLNITNYDDRNPWYNLSYAEFSFNNTRDDITNISINIVNDFSKIIVISNGISNHDNIGDNYKDILYFIRSIGELVTEETLIVLLMLQSFGMINCIVRFKELLDFVDFRSMVINNMNMIKMSRGFNEPCTNATQDILDDNFLFTHLHARAFMYQHFIEIWNIVKSDTPPTTLEFEVGNSYKHINGEIIHILGKIYENTYDGGCLVARINKSDEIIFVNNGGTNNEWEIIN